MSRTPQETFAREAVIQLRDAGYEALFAGGCVRDVLLGIEPTDFDVATSATPDEVRKVFGKRRTIPVGAAFGVMIVRSRIDDQGQIEVATFRTDDSYSDGRRPDSVRFSTPREDAQRRDFTINGMFFDPVQEELIDYVGGEADLRQRVVRAIGNPRDRIAEDKLRMLRAIRFAAKFAFVIDPETRQAVADSAAQVTVVSGERIIVELQKTLQTQHAVWALEEWSELGLLAAVLPEVAGGWLQNSQNVRAMIPAISAADWDLRLAALLWAAGVTDKAELDELKHRLKLSNHHAKRIQFAILTQDHLQGFRSSPWSNLQPLLVNENSDAALALFRARCLAGKEGQDFEDLNQLILLVPVLDPQPLLLGKDLIEMGLQPGPGFKLILEQIRAMQLDGQLKTVDEARTWIGANQERFSAE